MIRTSKKIYYNEYNGLCSNILEENIYVGARESSSTSNLNDQSKIGQLTIQNQEADVNIEPDNQQPHKNNQPDQCDVESDNNNDKTKKTVIDITEAKKNQFLEYW